jgi:hypothetical protein
VMTRVCPIHVNPREEHDVEDVVSCYASCCTTRIFIVVEDMESGTNTLYGFGTLFVWDVKLGKDHGVIVFLMLHGGLGACHDARMEDLGFEDSNQRMDM